MERILLVFVASVAAFCGSSSRTPEQPIFADRDLGTFSVGDHRFRILAHRESAQRNPCEPTWGRSRACTDSVITTRLVVESGREAMREETPFAYDPGWTGGDRWVVAERDTGSFRRIAARTDALLRELHIVSCTDATHAAFRVESESEGGVRLFTTFAILDGSILGFTAMLDEAATCADALRAGAPFDARYADDRARGERRVFDAAVSDGSLAVAIDFAFAHPFTVDVLRERTPTIDTRFFERLAASLPGDAALREHLRARLAEPGARVAEGARAGRSLPDFVRRLVSTLPTDTRLQLAHDLLPLCAGQAPDCPPFRRAALFEAALAMPVEARCAVGDAAPIRVDASMDEDLAIAFAEVLSGCEDSIGFAAAVLARPGAFVARDATFIHPRCIDAIENGISPTRCASIPTFAVLVATAGCSEDLLRAARTAAESGLRPWQIGALAVFRRCGRSDELAALVGRLRPTPAYQEDGIRQQFEHTFPERRGP